MGGGDHRGDGKSPGVCPGPAFTAGLCPAVDARPRLDANWRRAGDVPTEYQAVAGRVRAPHGRCLEPGEIGVSALPPWVSMYLPLSPHCGSVRATGAGEYRPGIGRGRLW